MDSNHPTTDDAFRDAAILLFAERCLMERGLQGAMGCASLAVDFADELLAKRNERNSARGAQ